MHSTAFLHVALGSEHPIELLFLDPKEGRPRPATVAFLPSPPPARAPLTALHAGHARWAADLGLAALMSWRGRGWNQRYEDGSILWAPSRVVPEILAAHRHTHGIQSLFWE